ncbi:MAG: SLBB domain-containing protein [Gemmatimonas sp.]
MTQLTWPRARLFLQLLIVAPLPLLAQPGGPLAPGDRVTLRLPGETAPRELLEVDHQGILTLPRVGPINATQLELTPLTDSIRALYRPMFNSSDVTVLLLRRITVLGEVKRPGVLYMDPSSSVRDAIASAEGATEFADISHVNLIRGNEKQRVLSWELASAQTLPLRSGDAIMMDRESWARRNASSLLGALGILASIAVALSR